MHRNKLNYCFQQAEGSNTHMLYIYDDVSEFGSFNWMTWEYEESETSAKYFRDQLAEIPETDTIELHINSNGGSVKEGVTIYNLLKQSKAHKVGIVDGVAYSIAFVILQACDERVMGVGTSALIHDMWVYTQGNARELRKVADDLDVLSESNRQIFLERSTLEEDRLIEMMGAETFLTPDQCLEYGLIDRVEHFERDQDTTLEGLQKRLAEVMQQMREEKSFRQQLEEMAKPKLQEPESEVPEAPAENNMAIFFSRYKGEQV